MFLFSLFSIHLLLQWQRVLRLFVTALNVSLIRQFLTFFASPIITDRSTQDTRTDGRHRPKRSLSFKKSLRRQQPKRTYFLNIKPVFIVAMAISQLFSFVLLFRVKRRWMSANSRRIFSKSNSVCRNFKPRDLPENDRTRVRVVLWRRAVVVWWGGTNID